MRIYHPKRIFNALRKLLSGQDITKVLQDKARWDRQFARGTWDFLYNKHGNAIVIREFVERVAEEKGTVSILDVGCGNGALALVFEKAGIDFTYTGIDISDVAVEQGKKVFPRGTFIAQDINEKPKVSGTYDIVLFSEILLYVHYREVLELYKPLLKKGAFIIVSLYVTWRTKLIWHKIRDLLTYHAHYVIKDEHRNISWDIRLAEYARNHEEKKG